MDMGGNFEILVFEVGKKKTDPSYARLRIAASNKEKLRAILSDSPGWCPSARSERCSPCPRQKRIALCQKGFTRPPTTRTQVKCGGEWVAVEAIEMDFLIVVDPVKVSVQCPNLSGRSGRVTWSSWGNRV